MIRNGVRSQKAVTRKGLAVKVFSSGEGRTPMVSIREGACHGDPSGVGRADGQEPAEEKYEASTSRRSAGVFTRRRGRAGRKVVGRTRARMARTPDRRPGQLR